MDSDRVDAEGAKEENFNADSFSHGALVPSGGFPVPVILRNEEPLISSGI